MTTVQKQDMHSWFAFTPAEETEPFDGVHQMDER